MEMFREISIERRAHPTGNDDLVNAALSWEIDGEKISDDDLVAFFLLMFEAGLDTVTNELSYATWHLATHPEDRQRILDDPALIPFAIEEFLRYYAIVTPSRKAMADVVHHGCPIKKGDMVYLPLAAATRDPREFPEADRVVIDRSPNNHIAFGAGPHRCLGSHLARREMRIALEEWHKRIPSYEVPEGADVPEYIGVQMGIQSLPLRLH
jgi:cytochrome P450